MTSRQSKLCWKDSQNDRILGQRNLLLCLAEKRQALRLLKEECKRIIEIRKKVVCFVDTEKAFVRVPR